MKQLMNLSDKGIELLKELEGFRPRPYADVAGKMTIGYGHLIVPGDGIAKDDIIEEVQALGHLRRDVQHAVDCVNQAVVTSINQNQFDALVIFAYNIGNTAFQNSSLLQLLNRGDMHGAACQFPLWCKTHTKLGMFVEQKGLRNRRMKEQGLFLS